MPATIGGFALFLFVAIGRPAIPKRQFFVHHAAVPGDPVDLGSLGKSHA
jgi:hypothetical protein